jgi:hypothetical protein
MTKEWHFIIPEFTLAKLCVELMTSQPLKYDSQMLFMLFILFEYTSMSSMKTIMDSSNSGMNMEFMRYMKCASTFVNPNNMTRYS